MPAFDVAVLADLRFPGGTSTALVEELKAAAAGGYRTALLPLKSPVLRYPHPMHPGIRACIDTGQAELMDPLEPVECGLLLVHHPQLLTHLPQAPLRLRADTRLLVVHHPPDDGVGAPAYDGRAIDANLAAALGGPVRWAPVGPAVRAQLARHADGPALAPEDWVNILDPEPWRTRRAGFADARCVVGRHSRPDPLKWLADRAAVLEVYPDDPRFLVRVLGGGPFLDKLLGGPPPAGWQVTPFQAGAAPRFLAGVDFYLYYHHPAWVEAFGRAILEAMAAGCTVILPPAFEVLFGEGALYAPAADAAATALALRQDWPAFQRQGQAALTLVRERFGPDRHLERLRRHLGPPGRRLAPGRALKDGGWAQRGPRRVLLVTSNGIGLGHLTRMLAVAQRLPPKVEPVFVTMSQAIPFVQEAGFQAEHLPYHAQSRVDVERWNRFLELELLELCRFYDPAVLVFDGNLPYGGLLSALKARPTGWAVWMRRALWRVGSGAEALRREPAFDVVLEPGELASSIDRGPTTASRGRTRLLAPVRLGTDSLTREAARAALDLPREAFCVLLQLGSGNNFDYAIARRRAGELLMAAGAVVVALESPIADRPPPPGPGLQLRRIYPIGRHLKAFDAAVSAAGYNAFHELLLAGVPTLFVPNEHPMMDDQGARARWAERCGLALQASADDPFALARKLAILADAGRRAELKAGMARLPRENGAGEAAAAVVEMAYTLRADRP